MSERDCNTCRHHVQAGFQLTWADGLRCGECLWSLTTSGELSGWEGEPEPPKENLEA